MGYSQIPSLAANQDPAAAAPHLFLCMQYKNNRRVVVKVLALKFRLLFINGERWMWHRWSILSYDQ